MNKDVKIYFDDILESIEKIEKYLKSVDRQDFLENDELQDAIVRRFEIIGEAANRIPQKYKDKYSKIPWNEIRGMRNILVHVYSEANFEDIWDTVVNDLPNLKLEIIKILNAMLDEELI